jgi:hypothetical protein
MAKASLPALSFTGSAAGNTFNIDLTNGLPIPTGNVTFTGSGGADTFVVTGSSSGDSVTLNNGSASFAGGLTATYTSVTSANVSLAGGGDTLNFNNPGIAVTFSPGSGSDTLNVQAGAFTSGSDIGAGSSLTVNVSTGASATFNSTEHLANLALATGSTATVGTNGSRVLVTSGLSLNGSATLDLSDNDMVLEYSGASPYATIAAAIFAARNGGAWNGTGGITSSAAAANGAANTTLGLMESLDYSLVHGGAFDGENPDLTALLVKYTYNGDANFSGSVSFDDYVKIDTGFNTGLTGWVNGDFNYSGGISFDDYVLIDTAFNTQGAAL